MRWTFDSREVKPGMGFIALKGEKVDGHQFIDKAKAAGAVDVIDGLEELQSRAASRRAELKATVVGVTGSAGKTTTKELLKTFLAVAGRTYGTEGNFNNHIGLPLTILNCPEDADFLVLEMGSNHPGEIPALCEIAKPDIGVVTGVGTAHLEFFGTRAGIAAEKGALLEAARDFGVYPAGDDFAVELASRGMDTRAVDSSHSPISGAEELYPPHFSDNAALAFAVAERFGVSREAARQALTRFELPGARWRKVEKDGVMYIDDTYNANPDSMIAAIQTLVKMPCSGHRIAILGDMFELGAESAQLHERVFAFAAQAGLSQVVAVGEESSRHTATKAYANVASLKVDLPRLVSPGDLILLKASHGLHLGEILI